MLKNYLRHPPILPHSLHRIKFGKDEKTCDVEVKDRIVAEPANAFGYRNLYYAPRSYIGYFNARRSTKSSRQTLAIILAAAIVKRSLISFDYCLLRH